MTDQHSPEPLCPPAMHDPSTVAVVEIEGRWYTRFTTLALPDPRHRGRAAVVGTTYYMPHESLPPTPGDKGGAQGPVVAVTEPAPGSTGVVPARASIDGGAS